MTAFADQPDRDAIAGDLESTLVVEAAAGTGKTTALVGRILRMLASGRAAIDKIVAVTFTEKAAGELKLRLREALERERAAAADDLTRSRLDVALMGLEETHVGTIHGFCADLLRERPVEAGVDPLFAVLTEGQAERLFGESFSSWLQAQLENPPDGLRRALRRSTGFAFARPGAPSFDEGPIDRLRAAAWELADWRDFRGAWERPTFDREGAIDELVRELQAFETLSSTPSYARDPLYVDTASARHLSQEIALQRSIGTIDYDGWEARLVDLSRTRSFARARPGRGAGYRRGVTRAAVTTALEQLRGNLDRFRMDADADLAALLQGELAGAVDRYEEAKRRAGALDFLDLLLAARNLVRDHESVRRGFSSRFRHIFVDEFQDTDPLQAEILLLLASADLSLGDWRTVTPEPGRLFVVGDPKQSIYRFRRADVGVYLDVCRRLERAGARRVTLTTSFRSVPEIQACVNAAFAPLMTGDEATLQAGYVALSPYRPAIPDQPALVVLPVPEPYGQRNVSMIAIEKSLPDAVGAFVEWLVTKSGWRVSGRGEAPPVPVQSRHVCILFRRFMSFGQDMTAPYVRALEARAVGHVLVGGRSFHEREEVEALRAALAAIEWPDDQLSVFATLRGPLFAIGDEELLEWRHRFRRPFHPFRVPADLGDATHLRPIADALDLLRTLHRRRNYVPIAQTVQALLDATRAHVGFVLRSGGEQSLANVLHVLELSRQYEIGGGLSFRGFVDELRTAAERAQAGEAPILEEGSDGVRLMTVHKAKGLEFPVVILADLTCKLNRLEPGRWIDPERGVCALKIAGLSPRDLLLHGGDELAREQAEAVRLAYVAATRARDVLVVPAVGDGPFEGGWLDPLMPAIYPREEDRRNASRAPGCPAFPTKDSVLTRPDAEPARSNTVAPGAYRLEAPVGDQGEPSQDSGSRRPARRRPEARGSYTAVWWDPRTLALGADSGFGLRRDDLIVKDGSMFAVEDRLAQYERWKSLRAETLARGSTPSIRFETVTAWAGAGRHDDAPRLLELADPAPAVDVRQVGTTAGRPFGPRFGTLVHAVLATAALDANAATLAAITHTQARILGAPPEERDAASAAAAAVLADPLLERARAAQAEGRCFRELPVTWLAGDGTLLEGTVDLAFEETGGMTVLDFKTDRELEADLDRYRRQLTIYCRALGAVRGVPARGILLRV
ncbi:MAG TPA: UvrD-helicase domain-containing protein [Vicinamibacterales bacterium]|nr:UvrD-helicase domain-containing protein [Vicinamibacterales bacterium]